MNFLALSYICLKKRSFATVFTNFFNSWIPFLIRLSISQCPNDRLTFRNCTKHYPGSLPGVLSRVSLSLSPISKLAVLYTSSRLFTRTASSINYNFNGRILPEERRVLFGKQIAECFRIIIFCSEIMARRWVVLFWHHALDNTAVNSE